MSWTDTSYTSQRLTPPPAQHTHTHTHTPFPFQLFYSSTLSVSIRIKERGRRRVSECKGSGGGREGGKEKKNRETGEIRLSLGLAEGQSWQAWRLNCWLKILFIITRSLFPNSPLLYRGQCPASMSHSQGFIRHCWAVRKQNLLLYNSSTDPIARTMTLPPQLRRLAWVIRFAGPIPRCVRSRLLVCKHTAMKNTTGAWSTKKKKKLTVHADLFEEKHNKINTIIISINSCIFGGTLFQYMTQLVDTKRTKQGDIQNTNWAESHHSLLAREQWNVTHGSRPLPEPDKLKTLVIRAMQNML